MAVGAARPAIRHREPVFEALPNRDRVARNGRHMATARALLFACSPEAARALVKRLHLPRQKANDGKVLVSEINHRPMSARSPAGHHPVTAALKGRVEELEAALAKVEAAAAGHRADFERGGSERNN